MIIDMRGKIATPFDPVVIRCEAEGSGGGTHCEAWRGQYEIERLESAGYTVVSVEVAS